MFKRFISKYIISIAAFIFAVSLLIVLKYFDFNSWGLIGDFANILGIAIVIVAILIPLFSLLVRSISNLLYPRPGSKQIDAKLSDLKRAFKLERGVISFAMVPEHIATAKAATNTRNIDLGNARLVLPEEDQFRIRDFIRRSRQIKTPFSSLDLANQDILIVTGEPGAGKSVLMQEIHATLSRGVEDGKHSLIPLFVFARDLNLDLLKESLQNENPMRYLLSKYYTHRFTSQPSVSDIKHLALLIHLSWASCDFLIIFDGLDEIAQRSAYEEIQKKLSDIILADLEHNQKVTHRYILSCRIDEDLEIFPNAYSVYLKGLNEKQSEMFCHKLIENLGLGKQNWRRL